MSHARLMALFALPAWLFAVGLGIYIVVGTASDAAFGYGMIAAGVLGMGLSGVMLVTGRPRRWGYHGQEQTEQPAGQQRHVVTSSWWDISF